MPGKIFSKFSKAVDKPHYAYDDKIDGDQVIKQSWHKEYQYPYYERKHGMGLKHFLI